MVFVIIIIRYSKEKSDKSKLEANRNTSKITFEDHILQILALYPPSGVQPKNDAED